MKTISFLLVLLAVSLSLSAQEVQIISGIVYNENGSILYGAKVSQDEDVRINFSDLDGAFHLVVRPELNPVIRIWKKGHPSVYVSQIDTITGPLHIVLPGDTTSTVVAKPDSISEGQLVYEDKSKALENSALTESRFSIQVDFTEFGFGEFANEMDTFNANFLSGFNRKTIFEYGWTFPSNVDFGIHFGWGRKREIARDSIQMDLSRQLWGLSLGYALVNTSKVKITPKLVTRMYHFKLLNYNDENKIPLGQYVDQRDLSLIFNQPVAMGRIDVAYNLKSRHNKSANPFLSIGAYAGYAQPLSNSPWLRGLGKRLATDEKLRIENINYGFTIQFHAFESSELDEVD